VPEKIESKRNPKMSTACAERNMKDYLYDNPDLKEDNCKKSSPCSEILDNLTPDCEVWLLQVPKCFDPKNIEINSQLGDTFDSNGGDKAECSATRFKEKISFACIAPEKAQEYELVCDSIKLIKPVGKIVVTKNKWIKSSEESICDEDQASDSCSEKIKIEKCESDDETRNPITSKKLRKKVNDQLFTIETTLTVENCADRSEKRKSKNQDSKHLKKKKSIKQELDWMNDDC
jgi:hypothetical protein